MEQIAFYRKYRPHNFDNLVGQDYIKTTLMSALKTNHVSHAYLFSGPRGTGKTSAARLLAKALNCASLEDKYEPCNECEFCVDINEGKLIDLIEIDAASNRGIDEVRDLREKINFAPTRAKYKVYIIDEVHMMTKEAFNALLKTLEEPPSHAFFILATTEIHKIPETIISRCQCFDFKRIDSKALMTRLSYIAQLEKIKAEDKALELISRYVDGSLRDAIGLLEQLASDGKLLFKRTQEILGVSDLSLLEKLFEALNSNDTKAALKIIHELHDQGSNLKKFIHDFVDNLRNKMLKSIAENKNEETEKLIRMIEIFQETQEKLQTVNIPQLPLEIAVIRIAGPVEVAVAEEPQAPAAPEVSKEAKPKEKISDDREHKSVSKVSGGVLSLDLLKENWPRITERVKSPSLRLSLKNGIPVKVENHSVTLEFNTKFHRDKVMEHDHRVELEVIIKEVIEHSVKILSIVKELEIKSVVEEKPSKGETVVGHALDIFGGEVMD